MKKVIGEFFHNYVASHEVWGCEHTEKYKDMSDDTYMLSSVVKI